MTIRTTIYSCKRLFAVGALGSAMALAGCDIGTQGESGPNLFYPVFDLNAMETPQPINFAFLGTQDGTLQIGTTGDPGEDGLINQLNTLDGWSTTAPVNIPFAGRVSEDSLAGNLHVLNVVMTSANSAESLQDLLALGEALTIDIASPPQGEVTSDTLVTDIVQSATIQGYFTDETVADLVGEDFFLDPEDCAFQTPDEDGEPACALGFDYVDAAEILGLLVAARETLMPVLVEGFHAPRTGHMVPVQACGEVTDLFEPAVAQANPNNVLLKPRTAVRSGDDPTCKLQTQIGLLGIFFQDAANDTVVLDLANILDDEEQLQGIEALAKIPPGSLHRAENSCIKLWYI